MPHHTPNLAEQQQQCLGLEQYADSDCDTVGMCCMHDVAVAVGKSQPKAHHTVLQARVTFCSASGLC